MKAFKVNFENPSVLLIALETQTSNNTNFIAFDNGIFYGLEFLHIIFNVQTYQNIDFITF